MDLSQEEFFIELNLLPEQKLYACIVLRALDDIRITMKYIQEGHYNINCFRRSRDYVNYSQKRGYQLSNEEFKSAIEYVFSDNVEKFFSIRWHLENLFPDSQWALIKLRRDIKKKLSECPTVYNYYDKIYKLDRF